MSVFLQAHHGDVVRKGDGASREPLNVELPPCQYPCQITTHIGGGGGTRPRDREIKQGGLGEG